MTSLLRAKELLENHHSKPRYILENVKVIGLAPYCSGDGGRSSSRTMSWRSSHGWGGDWNQHWDRKPKGKPDPKRKSDKRPGFMGYDGTPLRLPSGQAASSKSKEKTETTGLQQIKGFLTEMAKQGNFNAGHPLIAQLIEEDKDQELKDAQKALNNKRKAKRKVEQLRQSITTKEKDFKEWKHSVKTMLQEETKRFEENMGKMRQDLVKAEEAMEKGEEEKEESMRTSDEESSEEEKEQTVAKLAQMQQMLEETLQKCNALEANNRQMAAHLRATSLNTMSPTASPPMVMSPSATALRSDMPSMKPFAPERRAPQNVRTDPYGPGGAESEEAKIKRISLQALVIPDDGKGSTEAEEKKATEGPES